MKKTLASALTILCTVNSQPTTQDATDYQNNRDKWDATGPVQDYDFKWRQSTLAYDCSALMYVEVRGATVSSFTYLEDEPSFTPPLWNAGEEPPDYCGYGTTINGLFDTISGAIDDAVPEFQATYDNYLGYPTSVYIDWDLQIEDDEFSVSISNLCFPKHSACENNAECCSGSCNGSNGNQKCVGN